MTTSINFAWPKHWTWGLPPKNFVKYQPQMKRRLGYLDILRIIMPEEVNWLSFCVQGRCNLAIWQTLEPDHRIFCFCFAVVFWLNLRRHVYYLINSALWRCIARKRCSTILYRCDLRVSLAKLYIRVQRFGKFVRKLRIRILVKVQNKILRPVFKKTFFNIFPQSFQILVKNFSKALIGPKKN